MSDPAALSDLDALAQRQIARLELLAERGMRMTELVMDQAEVAAAAGQVAEVNTLSLALDRATRMVRRVMALQHKLAFDRDALIKEAERASKAAASRAEADAARQAERDAFTRKRNCPVAKAADAVDGLIERDFEHDEERCEQLFNDLHDLTDSPDVNDTRPIPEIIAEICQGLGIEPDWGFWEGEDWMEGSVHSDPSPEHPP